MMIFIWKFPRLYAGFKLISTQAIEKSTRIYETSTPISAFQKRIYKPQKKRIVSTASSSYENNAF